MLQAYRYNCLVKENVLLPQFWLLRLLPLLLLLLLLRRIVRHGHQSGECEAKCETKLVLQRKLANVSLNGYCVITVANV